MGFRARIALRVKVQVEILTTIYKGHPEGIGGLVIGIHAAHHHRHIRQPAHGKQIFQGLMRGPIRPDRNAAMSPGNQNIEIPVAHRSPYLVKVTGRGKRRVRAQHRQLPFLGQPRRRRRRRLLRNPHADPALLALRLISIKIADRNRTRNIQSQAYDALVLAVLGQRLPKAFARRLHLRLHRATRIPPVIPPEFWSLGIQLPLHLSLVFLSFCEQSRDINFAFQPEFREPIQHFIVGRCFAMPPRDVLHEADAFALHSLRDNHHRFARPTLCLLQRLHNLLHIVPVNPQHFPAKAAIFLFQWIDIHDVRNRPINLQTVLINDADQVIQPVMTRLHGRFPDLSFLLLAVPHDAKSAVILPIQFSRQCHAHGQAQALPQRPRRNLHPRQLQPMRMPLVWRRKLAQKRDILHRTKSRKRQPQVKTRCFMSSRPDNAVAIFPIGICGIMLGHAQIERRSDVHNRQRSAGVPAALG